MYVRQREQAPVIHGIGDIFLDAATEFRLAYPIYVGHLPVAEKRVKDELDHNAEFRRFLEASRVNDSTSLIKLTNSRTSIASSPQSRRSSTRVETFPQ